MYLPEIQLETLRTAKADLVKTESATPGTNKNGSTEKSPFLQLLEKIREQENEPVIESDGDEWTDEAIDRYKSLSYNDFFKSNDFFGEFPAKTVFEADLSDETAEPLELLVLGGKPLNSAIAPDEISERIANLFLFPEYEISEDIENSLLVKNDIATPEDETEKERDNALSFFRTIEMQPPSDFSGIDALQTEDFAIGAQAETGIGKKLVGGDDALIKVVDERTDTVAALFAPKEDQFITKVSFPQSGTAEMQLSLTDSGQALVQGLFDNTDGKNAAPQESLFSSMLSAEIERAANDFVKAGSIVLRDNNAGNINLVLHPETLGDVKIHLKLTDNVIAGQILVTSEDAYRAFKNSLETLKAAFQSGGFEAGQFDLSWSQNENGQQQRGNTPWKNPLVALREYDDTDFDIAPNFGENTYSRRGRVAVDMIA
jgi:flagellar hook-length control protein FliK